jgi:hypothetical protein
MRRLKTIGKKKIQFKVLLYAIAITVSRVFRRSLQHLSPKGDRYFCES